MTYYRKIIEIAKAKLLSKFCKKQKHHQNCILLSSLNQDYKDNTKALFEHLIHSGYNAYYIAHEDKIRNCELLQNIRSRIIQPDSADYYSAISQCKYAYFTHSERDIGWHLPQSTIRVNLWHGSPLKKMGYDSPQDRKWLKKYRILGMKTPYERWDYILIASNFFRTAFKSALHYPNEKILTCGLPRNSKLLENEHQTQQNKTEKNYLYAPTYRTTSLKIADECRTLKKLFSNIKKSRLHIRLHPFDKALLNDDFFDDITIDASLITDIYEALSGFDALITDYSSIAFDFAITRKPIHLYCPDLNEYTKERGGLYFPPHELPFHFSSSPEELYKKIGQPANYNPEQFSEPASLRALEMLLLNNGALDEDTKNQPL